MKNQSAIKTEASGGHDQRNGVLELTLWMGYSGFNSRKQRSPTKGARLFATIPLALRHPHSGA